MLENLTTHDI
jgi:hypothetical protein